jgi:GNAT superfamily N-acetyltransferase
MTGRQLGTMQIENDLVVVTDRLLETIERREIMASIGETDSWWLEHISEWVARIDQGAIAYGTLIEIDKNCVTAYVCVKPDRRGLGIGRFMSRFAVDLAIRNRYRLIVIQVDNDAAKAIALDLEFEPVPDRPEYMQRELKWVETY